MSSRFADPSTMRTRSPIYHDDSPKRPPPSPSNKAPPPKKLDAKSRAVSEEPFLLNPSKAQAIVALSTEPLVEACPDKVRRPGRASPWSLYSPEDPPRMALTIPKSSGNRVVVDMSVFGQILELDDPDDDREFSRGMVESYLQQAETTMKLMDECFANHASSSKHEELTKLGKHGHFLKGSSAALGVVQVQEICEKIQHLGNRFDPDKEPEAKISVDDAFARIRPLLSRLKDEQAAAEKWLNKFCDEGCKP